MENQVTLTAEEIQKFKEFQFKNQELINVLGQIEFQKLNLEITRDNIKQEMLSASEEQNNYGRDIQTKYGEGSIDIEKGLFIPYTSGA